MAQVFDEYQKRGHTDSEAISIGEAFTNRFGIAMPEEMNSTHEPVIVAYELDSAKERVVRYLVDEYGVRIIAVFFRVFRDGEREYLRLPGYVFGAWPGIWATGVAESGIGKATAPELVAGRPDRIDPGDLRVRAESIADTEGFVQHAGDQVARGAACEPVYACRHYTACASSHFGHTWRYRKGHPSGNESGRAGSHASCFGGSD